MLPRVTGPSAHTSCVSGSVSHLPGEQCCHPRISEAEVTQTHVTGHRKQCEKSPWSLTPFIHIHAKRGLVRVNPDLGVLRRTMTFQAPRTGQSVISRFPRSTRRLPEAHLRRAPRQFPFYVSSQHSEKLQLSAMECPRDLNATSTHTMWKVPRGDPAPTSPSSF